MNPYWSELVKRLHPYVPGEQPHNQTFIKLNTNENPYPPSPQVMAAISAAVNDQLRLYPDPVAGDLCSAIASFYNVATENVFVGNGSDEVLALSFMAFFTSRRALLFPDISYSFYPVYCDLYDITPSRIPLEADLTLDLDRYDADNGGIIFPNPNAPTSMAIDTGRIETLLERNTQSVVVVDEAYVDFGAQSAVSLTQQYPNLLVIQTMSKSRSLAGLRVGFAIGDAGLIDALNRVKDSFNSYPIDRLAQVAATTAMQDVSYFRNTCKKIIDTRERSAEQLIQLGFTVQPSSANFLFVTHPQHNGMDLSGKLRSSGILVRHWSSPRIENYLRISIGTDNEMDQLMTVLGNIL